MKIQYIGLRNGEKIEKTFFDNEVITKTEINGIMSTTSRIYLQAIRFQTN